MRKTFFLFSIAIMGLSQFAVAQTTKSASVPVASKPASSAPKEVKAEVGTSTYSYVTLSAELTTGGELLMREPAEGEVSSIKQSIEANPEDKELYKIYEAMTNKSLGFSNLLNIYGSNGYELVSVVQPTEVMKAKVVTFVLKKKN